MDLNRRGVLSLGLGSAAGFVVYSPAAMATDQTAILQAQIDAAQASGGVVTLAAETYQVTTLNIAASIVINGVPGKTVLQSLNGGTIVSCNSVSGVVISGVVFDSQGLTPPDGDLETTYQLLAYQCAQITVEKCIFRNAKTSGAGFDACTGRVTGNQFFKIGQIALRAGRFFGDYKKATGDDQAAPLRGMEISGNRVHDVGNGGIYVFHNGPTNEEDSTIVSNNYIERISSGSGNGPYGNGIDVYAANNVIVANNRVSDCDFSGIRVVSSKHCQVTGNNISRIADKAIFVEFSFESVIVSENIVEDVNFGIQVSGGGGVVGATAVVANNIVTNVNRPGTDPQVSNFIGIDIVSIATNCVGNVVDIVGSNSHGPGIGILVMDWSASHYHQIASNIVKGAGCGIGLVLGSGATKVSVTGNTIAAAAVAYVSVLDQVAYADGSINTLVPTGWDLTVKNTQSKLVLLENNITLN